MASSSSLGAFAEGHRRVVRAWVLVIGVTALTFLVALPLSLALRGMLADHLGPSLAAEQAARGANYEWWQEFQAQATGLGTTFTPSIVGFGAVLDNISGLLDNLPLAATVTGVTAAWLILWTFLSGGILDRLARDRKTRAFAFFGACGVHFWRLLRLAVLALFVYWVLFGWLHAWLFTDLYERFTRDLTVERTAFVIRAGAYLAFATVVACFNLLFDYARIRLVVEDRRSAVGAVLAAARFLRRHPASAALLYIVNGGAFILLVVLYAAAAPGAPGDGLAVWGMLAIGQIYILARHYLKLVFYASQTAFFQAAFAHRDFTAAPPALWPDSPAAESIANAGSLSVR